MRLYRPVGLNELALIYDAEMRAFPPRLPEQPIFYPVLNAEYASQIARLWNTKASSLAGYVTAFDVEDRYAARFERHIVGTRQHEELWVPAEKLAEFNRRVVGRIAVIAAYFGEGFQGYIPDRLSNMQGKDATRQFVVLEFNLGYNAAMDFTLEIALNHKAVFLHLPFWAQHDFSGSDISTERRDEVLRAIGAVWADRFPDIKLCCADIA